MAPPRRKMLATAEETLTPPETLPTSQSIAKIGVSTGNNVYSVELPSGATILVELSARFRSTFWLKRGGFVLVDTVALSGRDNKLDGEIINVVRDEKRWRKQPYWPPGFTKKAAVPGSEEESTVGKMPPSDESDAS